MPAAELKQRWKNGEAVYGAAIRLATTWAPEYLAHAGLDFIYIDLQHGFISLDDLLPMCQALNGYKATAITRIPSQDRALIGKVLETGCEGVIVPMVESAEEAERVVAATRFGPDGIRSNGTLRLRILEGGMNREVIVLVMIETKKGVENASEIAAVPGVDGVFIGPSDLALSYGLTPSASIQPGVHADAVAAIRAACDEHGKVTAITGDPEEMKALGFKCINIGGDTIFMEAAAKEAIARLK